LQIDKKQSDEMFEWMPPDISKELAMDYMKALPTEKLPIKGSIGAALRRQLLQKQLPLHDIDYKICDELSEEEQKQFEKYLENIKKYVGQGKVMKVNFFLIVMIYHIYICKINTYIYIYIYIIHTIIYYNKIKNSSFINCINDIFYVCYQVIAYY